MASLFASFSSSVKRRAMCFVRELYLRFLANANAHVVPELILTEEPSSLNDSSDYRFERYTACVS